jgi:glycine/D-amino acid oxidase-like deaminating enzyme
MTSPATAPSMWLQECGEDLTPRPALPGDTAADVAIVGAGFTGLWTAYHLLRHDPALRVVVLEREIAGWGASGRNGGWCSALFPASWDRVSAEHGRDAAERLRARLRQAVDDVAVFCDEHGVDARFAKGGTLSLVRNQAQMQRRYGDQKWLDAAAATERLAATSLLGAEFTPHCAALDPARLVRGLARVVEQLGGTVYERTRVIDIAPGQVLADHGTVRAELVVRATEGYTADLPSSHRDLAPLWSLIIATEPLPAEVWESIGWRERETVTDGRHLIIYAQRTADGRIVFGGRGAPYRYGSTTSDAAGHDATYSALEQTLHDLLPQTRDARVTHRWGGVLGVPRDWTPAATFDRESGLAWAGGYVGDGVALAGLAGRTVADLLLGRDTDETRLPWVGHRWRRWEPEPLRWLGIQTMTRVMASADKVETRTGKPARRAKLLDRLVGE